MESWILDERGVVAACPSCGQPNRLRYEDLSAAVRCGRCKTAISPPNAPIDVPSSAVFDRLIAAASIPVVVDYWAPWCGPCRMVAPELQKVAARQAGHAIVVKVNTDALPDLGERFGIRSIPTLTVFAAGRAAKTVVGVRPAEQIEALVADAGPAVRSRPA